MPRDRETISGFLQVFADWAVADRGMAGTSHLTHNIRFNPGEMHVNNNEERVGYIPTHSQAELKNIGVDYVELERAPVSDGNLLDVFAVDGRADADAFDRSPGLVWFTRPATERERNALGLPPGAFAVASRTPDGCILTEYFA